MECPKCHKKVEENSTVCPYCHKVIQLECPNCHSLGENSVCEKCGYTILTKCSKCSRMVPVIKEICPKCKFPVINSLVVNECETDEFASIIIKFESLNLIKKQLKSQELYSKFYFKLKNLLSAQLKNVDAKIVHYNDVIVVNFNNELSLATSASKAIKLSLKILNAFVALNTNLIEELAIPLKLSLRIVRKISEELLLLPVIENNVKLLTVKKDLKKYLKGMQVVLDQYIYDQISKNYKTDSLYSVEEDGKSLMFYEVILDSYVLPPSSNEESVAVGSIKELPKKNLEPDEKDIYSFKVFDINAKCSFKKQSAIETMDTLSTIDLNKQGKIVALRGNNELNLSIIDIIKIYELKGYTPILVSCSEEMHYKPWGFFETIFKEFFKLPYFNKSELVTNLNQNVLNSFKDLFNFIQNKPLRAQTPEDARFAYMEQWSKLLRLMKNTVIIVDGFENLDDTSIQSLELYFDKYKSVIPNFVFITSSECSVHSKIKTLLRTDLYTEFSLKKSSIEECLSVIKSDATDFIQSFYYEKIKDNFNGSYLYFQNVLQYLEQTGALLNFENKLIVKSKKSVVLPKDLKSLYKSRIKYISKNQEISFIFAYLTMISPRLDIEVFEALGIKDVKKHIAQLVESEFIVESNEIITLINSSLVSSVVTTSLKREAELFLAKNIIGTIGKKLCDTTLATLMGRLGAYKEEYLTLWKNSLFALNTGDYDAYLKNCLGFLSLVEHIESNISQEEIESNKKEVFNNILLFLYSYSPAKIYSIENLLLMDAINQGDDEKIVKLSNLMLQGALITSNYSDALSLLHNILSRMQNPILIVDNEVNTKFLLLSLVNIEILYNIGEFKQAIEVAEDILSVINPENIENIKPASFSTNLFVSHLLETFRLVGFAKLYVLDDNFEEYFNKIKTALNVDLPEKDCILAVKEFLAGKNYSIGNVEEYSVFSKIILLILQEFTVLKDDYKRFAQNIYQAKLLANEHHQREIDMFCDLLIAYSYSKIGIEEKAKFIYDDILKQSEKSAMFNMMVLAKYFIAKLISKTDPEEALLLINDSLALIQKTNNQSKILYALLEKFYISLVEEQDLAVVDIESETHNLELFADKLKLITGTFSPTFEVSET